MFEFHKAGIARQAQNCLKYLRNGGGRASQSMVHVKASIQPLPLLRCI